jgi:hypothetical protein
MADLKQKYDAPTVAVMRQALNEVVTDRRFIARKTVTPLEVAEHTHQGRGDHAQPERGGVMSRPKGNGALQAPATAATPEPALYYKTPVVTLVRPRPDLSA